MPFFYTNVLLIISCLLSLYLSHCPTTNKPPTAFSRAAHVCYATAAMRSLRVVYRAVTRSLPGFYLATANYNLCHVWRDTFPHPTYSSPTRNPTSPPAAEAATPVLQAMKWGAPNCVDKYKNCAIFNVRGDDQSWEGGLITLERCNRSYRVGLNILHDCTIERVLRNNCLVRHMAGET